MTDYSFGCDRLEVYRTQVQAISDCRDTEHDMSANSYSLAVGCGLNDFASYSSEINKRQYTENL